MMSSCNESIHHAKNTWRSWCFFQQQKSIFHQIHGRNMSFFYLADSHNQLRSSVHNRFGCINLSVCRFVCPFVCLCLLWAVKSLQYSKFKQNVFRIVILSIDFQFLVQNLTRLWPTFMGPNMGVIIIEGWQFPRCFFIPLTVLNWVQIHSEQDRLHGRKHHVSIFVHAIFVG